MVQRDNAALNATLALAELSLPLAVLDGTSRELHGASPRALEALGCADASSSASVPREVVESLVAACDVATMGEPFEWRAPGDPDRVVVCTCHAYGKGGYAVLLRAAGTSSNMLLQRLHQQRLEITGRLVAMIAHDLRVPLSAIVFNADVAYERELSQKELELTLADIRSAAARMRQSIDGLLDFARLGGTKTTAVELSNVIARVESLLRPQVRDGGVQW